MLSFQDIENAWYEKLRKKVQDDDDKTWKIVDGRIYEHAKKRIQEKNYSPGMSGDFRKYVKSCEVCKKSKSSNLGQQSLIGQQKPADRPWIVISVVLWVRCRKVLSPIA
jgi:hypothetical protein